MLSCIHVPSLDPAKLSPHLRLQTSLQFGSTSALVISQAQQAPSQLELRMGDK